MDLPTTARIAIDWVVFDLGGVVLSPTGALPELADRIGAPHEDFVTAYHAHRRDYDRHSDPAVYWSAVAESCGAARPDRSLARELAALDDEGWSTTDPAVLALIDDLHRDGTRLAVLSNAPTSMGDLVRGRPWASVFEHVVISGDLGVIKPEPAIYAALLDALGAPADRVVFVDDRSDNVAAAAACGIRSVPFRGARELHGALADFGLLSVR